MSFSFMRAPAEGRLCAVNFSAETPAPRISSVVPTVVTERPFLVVKAWTPCVLVVVLVLSSDVLKFIKR